MRYLFLVVAFLVVVASLLWHWPSRRD